MERVPETTFEPRYAISSIRNPGSDELRDLIVNPNLPGREWGEALITFVDALRTVSLIVLNEASLGHYLKYDPSGDTWLSVGDRARLGDEICPDDWCVSAGLFVPTDKAWLAVSDFCSTGLRSLEIEWIRPSEIPPTGNS